jgi:hypothetical protein
MAQTGLLDDNWQGKAQLRVGNIFTRSTLLSGDQLQGVSALGIRNGQLPSNPVVAIAELLAILFSEGARYA